MIGVTLRGLAHHHVESKAAARNLTVGAQTRRVGGVNRVHAQATAEVRIKVVAIVEALLAPKDYFDIASFLVQWLWHFG
jgi:hypothetical protein